MSLRFLPAGNDPFAAASPVVAGSPSNLSRSTLVFDRIRGGRLARDDPI